MEAQRGSSVTARSAVYISESREVQVQGDTVGTFLRLFKDLEPTSVIQLLGLNL